MVTLFPALSLKSLRCEPERWELLFVLQAVQVSRVRDSTQHGPGERRFISICKDSTGN